jgi:hypothetical protein
MHFYKREYKRFLKIIDCTGDLRLQLKGRTLTKVLMLITNSTVIPPAALRRWNPKQTMDSTG